MYLSSDASLQSIPWMSGRIIPMPVAPSQMTCLIPIPPRPVHQNQTCPPIPTAQPTVEAPPLKREKLVDTLVLERPTRHIHARRREQKNQLKIRREGEREKGRGREGGGDIDVSEGDMKCRRRANTRVRDTDRDWGGPETPAWIITTTNLQTTSVVQPPRQCGTITGTRKQGNVNTGTTGVRGGERRHSMMGEGTELWLWQSLAL